jgi:flavin-binding protein dodecin
LIPAFPPYQARDVRHDSLTWEPADAGCDRCHDFLHANEDQRRKFMSEHVYKQIELTGSSARSIDDAVSTAIAKASKTLRNLHWFEVTETRGQIENDKVAFWQVTIKVGLRID